MNTENLLDCIEKTLEEMKAHDIVRLDIRELSVISDYFVLAGGNSERHLRAITRHLREALAEYGVRPLGVEGELDAQWILLDFDAVVVHLMSVSAREFYALERLWAPAEAPERYSISTPSVSTPDS